MSQRTNLAMSAFVVRRIRSEVDGRPKTVTYDVMPRWDVTSETGLVIGSEGAVDASSCMISTSIAFTPPT
ncbi:hypothetical protein [Rhizobium sp. 1399]|uniref:hypothetical protein n=1 Tax=Rhizobium sp. 1399 TaxID=2817758 RepID=UPI0028632C1F|nr:hypothetical protein [Rhizobium sp. 1399]MDR6664037.1 hypothetical protein [Rhizobium sp. 1399]